MHAQFLTPEHLRRIVCPVCHESLQLDGAVILCQSCGRRYPVVDGIPVLLVERAL